ncbi:hypothetical protein D3C87_1892650 [compost metagenome]
MVRIIPVSLHIQHFNFSKLGCKSLHSRFIHHSNLDRINLLSLIRFPFSGIRTRREGQTFHQGFELKLLQHGSRLLFLKAAKCHIVP